MDLNQLISWIYMICILFAKGNIVSIFMSWTWYAKLRVSASSAKLNNRSSPNFLCKEIHLLVIICEILEEFWCVLLVLKFENISKWALFHFESMSTLNIQWTRNPLSSITNFSVVKARGVTKMMYFIEDPLSSCEKWIVGGKSTDWDICILLFELFNCQISINCTASH